MRQRTLAAALTAAAFPAVLGVAACGSPPAASSAAAAFTPSASAAAVRSAAPSPSQSCKPTATFDYIERAVWPPDPPQADEIGNTDYADCESSLADFAATAGQAQGECTTIALASDNPGYNVNASPAAPLKDVIESAGPGC
jgi:hypothetical protein